LSLPHSARPLISYIRAKKDNLNSIGALKCSLFVVRTKDEEEKSVTQRRNEKTKEKVKVRIASFDY